MDVIIKESFKGSTYYNLILGNTKFIISKSKKKKGKKEGIKKEIPLDDLDWKKQIFLLLL